MDNWTPWHHLILIAIICLTAICGTAIFVWHKLTRRRIELDELGPDGMAARLLGEFVAQCGPMLKTRDVDELFRIVAAASNEQKRAVIAALGGLISESGGPYLVSDLPGKVLSVARRFGGQAIAQDVEHD